MKKIIIVDYGLGNVLSVKNAFMLFEENVHISDDIKEIESATHLIVPGVGSFSEGIKNLKKKKLDISIKNFFKTKKPILGICLGLQLFFSISEEFGKHVGLNLIDGKVVAIKKKVNSFEKLPVIGWQDLDIKDSFLKKDKSKKLTFYFDHSFMVQPSNLNSIKGHYIFDETKIPSLILEGKFVGCQFHPEKSGKEGLNLISEFLKL
jgi:imidazole glycerol-phosphate synthase subunit HisH